MDHHHPIHLYTDGACSGNPGPGGWGCVLKWNGHLKELSGGKRDTTNNRMEMTAVIEGLRAISRPAVVHVVSDSQYVIKGMTEWMAGWLRKGWRNSQGKAVENRDLWEELATEAKRHTVTWEWVRGHDGHPENERCDELAVAAIPK